MSWPQKLCELSGITGKYIDFSKIKLFCQRDNIDVSRKKTCKENYLNSISLWALNSKYLNIDFTNNMIFFWVLRLTATLIIFCRYIDDGFMLTSKANLPNIISNLYTSYPPQIPITFTSNHHTTHYLDLSLSLNHFTIRYHIVHYQIYQKPHHKYMYPHFSSNHTHHIFSGIIKTETIQYSRLSATIDNFNFIHHHFTLSLGSFSILTVTTPKTSLLKWIRVSSNFAVFIF